MTELVASLTSIDPQPVLVALGSVGAAYFAVERWVDGKAKAVEERVMFVRQLDMDHLNKRLDGIEDLIRDNKE